MMNIKVLVGDRKYRITQLTKETVLVSGRQAHTGRHIMTCTNGFRAILPAGVLPQMPCKTCETLKPINEPCDRTEACREAQRKAEEIIRAMQSRSLARVS